MSKSKLQSQSPAAKRNRLKGRLLPHYEKNLFKETNTLVLSDVDGTVLRGSLVLDHAAMLHEEGVIDLGDLVKRWQASPKDEELIFELAELYRKQIAGLKLSDLRIRSFIDSVVSTPERSYSTLERLKLHRAAGHRVVLISGSPIFLVRPFALRFGFDSIGSRYHRTADHRLTGLVTGMFGAPQKLEAVAKLQPGNYDRVIGYGDTTSDAPLLAASHYSVLVAPTNKTLQGYSGQNISEIIRD